MTNDNGGDVRLSGENPTSLALGEAFDLLEAPRRRWMLSYLAEHDGETIALEDVAEHVQKRCVATDGGTDRTVTDVYNELYHKHVPRLDRTGIANYDDDSDDLTLAALPEPIPELLDLASEYESV